jgi:hypothetical protein
MNCSASRWPPVYDFDSLGTQIKELVEKGLEEGFYKNNPSIKDFFQGDIFKLNLDFPYIDENGDIVAIESNKWLILGNTCDLTRDDLHYTNIIPLEELDNDVPNNIIDGLKQFQNYKKLFFPDVNKEIKGYVADLTKVCTIEKKFLLANAEKISELEFHSWVLFHSCIIRYFARDDGRND